ncbi:MAG: methyltransferase [Oscillospiraceae bacterium]|nr:methyltransferase [Oscillospiraceae bacterium]
MQNETLGRFSFSDAGAFPLSTDSMLLGSFASPKRGGRVCDLGCGSGVLGLLLLLRDPTLTITGFERDPAALACAAVNIRQNDLSASFFLQSGDLRDLEQLPCGAFSDAVSNPPYFPDGGGARRASGVQAASEESLNLDQLYAASARLLQSSGRLSLVHRPERLADLLSLGRIHHLEAKRIRFVRHHSGAPISLLLLELRKDARPGLKYEPDLLLYMPDGSESSELKTIYHKED